MKLQLEVLTKGKSFGHKIPITLSQFIVGRDKSCHLRPASAVISKRHCAILMQGNKAVVRDFGSTNGTFVNDDPVEGEHELENDDILKIGPLEFKVLLEKTTPVNKPTPLPEEKLDELREDDDVAAMLLSLGGEDDPSDSELDEEDIPGGSTIMDVIPLDGMAKEAAEKKAEEKKKADEKEAEAEAGKKKDSADSSSAAKAILEKYTRRQRR